MNFIPFQFGRVGGNEQTNMFQRSKDIIRLINPMNLFAFHSIVFFTATATMREREENCDFVCTYTPQSMCVCVYFEPGRLSCDIELESRLMH